METQYPFWLLYSFFKMLDQQHVTLLPNFKKALQQCLYKSRKIAREKEKIKLQTIIFSVQSFKKRIKKGLILIYFCQLGNINII